MKVTVGICTWNRAKLLNQTLGNMLSLHIPNGVTWELLVVNNNSTDETESVLTYFADKLPLRRLFEPCPGKSNALNRAVSEALGDLIIWTDDDVLVDRNWLAAYAAAVARWPRSSFFGGPIEPWFDGKPPSWLQQIYPRVEVAFAALNLGETPCLIPEGKLPFGANLAVLATVQRRYLYDRRLGLRPKSGLRGEETAVLEQMMRDGLEGQWVPDAKVQHFIPKERQTIRYLRSFYQGYGHLLELKADPKQCARLCGKPQWALRSAIENELLFWLKRFCSKPEFWIDNLIQASIALGFLLPPMSQRTGSQGQAPPAKPAV